MSPPGTLAAALRDAAAALARAAELVGQAAPQAPAPPPDVPCALSVAEAARRLGVSRDTVERRIRAGGLRAVRLAGRVLIPAAEVDRLLADGARR